MTFFKLKISCLLFSFVAFLLTLLVSSVFITQTAFANRIGAPGEAWITTQTAHFNIIHSAEQQDLGLYYAGIAEQAYENLASIFENRPDKVTVIINDSTDTSNGFATLIPYPMIMIYPVQVGNNDSLAEGGEWARELFTHELTHIFQLYPTEGFYFLLKPVFGSIIAPNLLMPTWWKEGMAVEMETQFSPRGRTRSSLQDAAIRSLVAENKLKSYSLPEANETLPTWPYGGRPYFFGSMIMSEIVADGKTSALNHIVARQAERVPYFIEVPHREALGRSYESQYGKTIATFTQNATEQIETLSQTPFSEAKVIDETLLSARNPRLHPRFPILGLVGTNKINTQILFYVKNNDQTYSKLKLSRKNPTGDISSFDFHPVDKKIIFSRVDPANARELRSELYTYDLITQKEKQLTFNARARDPQYSADGSQIIYISTAAGQTSLHLYDLIKEQDLLLKKINFDERITTAVFLRANEILYNVRNKKGDQIQYQLNFETGETKFVDSSNKQIRFIRKIGDNLYYTSLDNGVANIFESSSSFQNSKPLTHYLTGALSFDVSLTSKEIFATYVNSSGTQVVRTPFPDKPVTLPVIENKILQRYKYIEKPFNQVSVEQKPYEGGNYLWPRYWIPFIATNTANAGLFLQAITSGHDPLDIHTYNVSLNYDTYLEKFGYNVFYEYSAFQWPIDVTAKQIQDVYGTANNIFERSQYTLGVSPDLFSLSDKLVAGIGIIYSRIDSGTLETIHTGTYAQVAYKDFTQKIYQYFPMKGWGSLLRIERLNAQKDNGTDFGDYTQAIGSVMGFTSAFLPEDNAIMVKLNALYTFDNVRERFGSSNTVYPLGADSVIPQFALRGYKNGQFFGSRLATLNTEYRFPVKTLNKGSGTDAYFLKNITGAIVVDGLAVKGSALKEDSTFATHDLSQNFWSAGVEAKLNTTVGYLLPLNFVLGYYWPFSPAYAKSSQVALSLQIGGF